MNTLNVKMELRTWARIALVGSLCFSLACAPLAQNSGTFSEERESHESTADLFSQTTGSKLPSYIPSAQLDDFKDPERARAHAESFSLNGSPAQAAQMIIETKWMRDRYNYYEWFHRERGFKLEKEKWIDSHIAAEHPEFSRRVRELVSVATSDPSFSKLPGGEQVFRILEKAESLRVGWTGKSIAGKALGSVTFLLDIFDFAKGVGNKRLAEQYSGILSKIPNTPEYFYNLELSFLKTIEKNPTAGELAYQSVHGKGTSTKDTREILEKAGRMELSLPNQVIANRKDIKELMAKVKLEQQKSRPGSVDQKALIELLTKVQNIEQMLLKDAQESLHLREEELKEYLKNEEFAMTVDAVSRLGNIGTKLLSMGGENEKKAAQYFSTLIQGGLEIAIAVNKYQKVAEASSLALINIYLAAAVVVVMLIQISMTSGDTPEAAIMAGIKALQEQISQLKREMHARFDQVDSHLDRIEYALNRGFYHLEHKLEIIDSQVKELKDLIQVVISDTRQIKNNTHFGIKNIEESIDAAENCISKKSRAKRTVTKPELEACLGKLKNIFADRMDCENPTETELYNAFVDPTTDQDTLIALGHLKTVSGAGEACEFAPMPISLLGRAAKVLSDITDQHPAAADLMKDGEIARFFRESVADHEQLAQQMASSKFLSKVASAYARQYEIVRNEIRGQFNEAFRQWSNENLIDGNLRFYNTASPTRSCYFCDNNLSMDQSRCSGGFSMYTKYPALTTPENMQIKDTLFLATERFAIAAVRPVCYEAEDVRMNSHSGCGLKLNFRSMISTMTWNRGNSVEYNDFISGEEGISIFDRKPSRNEGAVVFTKSHSYPINLMGIMPEVFGASHRNPNGCLNKNRKASGDSFGSPFFI